MLAFIGDEDRRQQVEEILGKGNVAISCSGVSLYHYYLGNLSQAVEWRNKDLEIQQKLQNKENQANTLRGLSI